MGFDYLKQMESYLRDTLEASLVDSAYAVAGALNDKPRLFDSSFNEEENNLYVHRLNNTVQLDGYTDDWDSYIDWSDSYHSDSLFNSDNFKLIISKDDHYYYVLIQVEDDELIYSTLDQSENIEGDHFVVIYRDKYQRLQKDYFCAKRPGV